MQTLTKVALTGSPSDLRINARVLCGLQKQKRITKTRRGLQTWAQTRKNKNAKTKKRRIQSAKGPNNKTTQRPKTTSPRCLSRAIVVWKSTTRERRKHNGFLVVLSMFMVSLWNLVCFGRDLIDYFVVSVVSCVSCHGHGFT